MSAQLSTNVEEAARLLRAGKLVAFATETVYGLGANALNMDAVARVFAAKQRPHFDPLIVHLADVAEVPQIVAEIPPAARQLMEKFWPGPLTLVLPKQSAVPDLVTAGLPNVAVRIPDHPLALQLLRTAGVPVAAPSANPFGRISPTTAQHVLDLLADEIDFVLDGGPCRVGLESTVVQILPGEDPVLLRPGGLTIAEIESEIGPVLRPATPGEVDGPQAAPGRLLQHYAPRKPLAILESWSNAPHGPRVGVLCFREVQDLPESGAVEVLSKSGSLTEAAANFFAALRRLDASEIDTILAEPFPEAGLGIALNDRLRRAAH